MTKAVVTVQQWREIRRVIVRPWPRDAIAIDLQIASKAGESMSIESLSTRWGWPTEEALEMLIRFRAEHPRPNPGRNAPDDE